jgi:hypothetical protein
MGSIINGPERIDTIFSTPWNIPRGLMAGMFIILTYVKRICLVVKSDEPVVLLWLPFWQEALRLFWSNQIGLEYILNLLFYKCIYRVKSNNSLVSI